MLTRFYECNRCGYEYEHTPEPGEPDAEICPACLKPFRPTDTDNESEVGCLAATQAA